MAITPKILAFAGSTRTDSYNKRLVKIAAAGARTAGVEVTLIDLRDFPLPIFDGDLEARDGLPANGRKLKDLFLAHHGLLISAPEYNSSITAVLKNTIDWVSRPVPGEAPLACFDGKAACLMSASPGALGGLRGLVHVRAILGNIKVLVLPDQIAISKANEAFNPDGSLKDPKQQAAVEGLGAQLARVITKLHSE
jgi:NAD(P)H-dependent FMN reductase